MTDTLVVSGGGRIAVAPEDLLVAVSRCRLLAARLDEVAARLSAAAAGAVRVRVSGDRAGDLARRLRTTGMLLGATIDAYSAAERNLAAGVEVAAGQAAYWMGAALPALLGLIPLPVMLALGGWTVAGAPGLHREALGRALAEHRGLLSDVRVTAAIRVLAGTADDGLRGAGHVPWAASQLGDDRATGILGREAAARVLFSGLIGVGAAARSPVRVTAKAGAPVRRPRTVADLAARVPHPADGAPQVRVERYGDSSVAYLGGTQQLGLGATDEPWDLPSSVAAMGGAPADSVAAAAKALRAAGVGPDEPVLIVGYSQGGLIASRLASSGSFAVSGVVTLGSPGAAVPIPPRIPVLAVEHREDLVPALAGPRVDGSWNRVTATRSLYDRAAPDSPRLVPAHELSEYRATAALVDRSDEERLQRVRGQILAGLSGSADGQVTVWRADRTG